MNTEKYITASCVIRNNSVYKNGQLLFENKEASLPDFLHSIYTHIGLQYPKFYKMDNLSKLGFIASEILIEPENKLGKYKSEEIGVVITNAQSSLDTDVKYSRTMNNAASPALFVYTLPNILIGEMCIRNKIKGENAFFIFEKFNAEFIEKYVENLFNNDTLQACICGWVDLLDKDYTAVLYYVEKEGPAIALPFTEENIDKIYQLGNG